MIKAFLYSSLILLCTSCCISNGPYHLSNQSQLYIDEVIATLKLHSVKKKEIDWVAFRNNVYKAAERSKTIEDTYPAITYAINLLGDNHSYFAPAKPTKKMQEDKPLPELIDEKVPANIGYINLPFCIGDEKQTANYIQLITEKFARQNRENTKGWIVDLRDSFGGNMWPMMAAVSPLLSNGVQGYFTDADETTAIWKYESGQVFLNDILMAENRNVIALINRNIKIAVLTNRVTASSGEAMTVVFKGLPNAKSFGESTFGVSTGCESFTMSDGSRINLATSIFTDRNHHQYGNAIEPDMSCEQNKVLEEAIQWIMLEN